MHTAFRLSGQAWKGPKDGSDQQLEGYLRCRTIQMRKLELSDHTMIKKIGYKIVQGAKDLLSHDNLELLQAYEPICTA